MNETILQCRNLSKSYGGIRALKNLTLSLPRGALGLLGLNGAGKSTFLKLVVGLLQADEGTLEILGQEIKREDKSFLQKIGYMPETPSILPGHTAVTYLAFLGELSGLHRKRALYRAHETLHYVGLQEERYRPMENLSYGLKQRVLLAQALVHDPDIVLFDEPTTGLDPEGRKEVLSLLSKLVHRYNKGVIFSSHILEDIEEVCHYIVLLDKGSLIYQGPIENLAGETLPRYEIRFEGSLEAYEKILKEEGIPLLKKEKNKLQLSLPAPHTPNLLLEKAREAGGFIKDLKPLKISLEELFIEKIRGGDRED